jgi:hypothetical protein
MAARLARLARPLVLACALLAAGAAGEAAAVSPAPSHAVQRIQLHRNTGRSVNYAPLRQALQLDRTSALQMQVAARIELDGSPLDNVRGNVYPIDTDGDGAYEFLHFNGYRFMRVFERGGAKRWQVTNPKGRVHKDTIHRDTLAVLDVDGDRKQEIVHCWANEATGKKRLVVRRGTDGSVLREVDLDAAKTDICQLGAFYVAGRAAPVILVSHRVKAPDTCDHNFTDNWARTVAYDLELNKLWDRNTCNAGHYVYPVDGDFDGYAEAIFVGRHLLAADGTQRCRFPFWGSNHADAVNVADFMPARSGMEAVIVGETGMQMVDVNDCTVLWTKTRAQVDNPQHLGVAWLDPGAKTPTITVRSKGTVATPKVYMMDGSGKMLKVFSSGAISGFMPLQNANVDGAEGSDDLVGMFGQVTDRLGRIRLDKGWYWALKGTKIQEVPGEYPTSYDRWSAFPVVADLDGNGKDEIVTWSQSLIVVGKAVN